MQKRVEGARRGETAKREEELKDKEGSGKMQTKNRTEIRNAEIANTVQASVHKEANSCCGEKHRWYINSPLEVEARGESWKRDRFPFFPSSKGAKEVNPRRGGAKEEFALVRG